MKLVASQPDDIPAIMSIVADAQALLASLKIDQWQDGYPTQDIFLNDMRNGESYVVRDDRVMATAMFTLTGEASYNSIEGEWLTAPETAYGVIHRMAVSARDRGKGIARFILQACEKKVLDASYTTMRIDTHEDNKGMQKLLITSGYSYCGVIYLQSGAKRLAYEKLLSTT